MAISLSSCMGLQFTSYCDDFAASGNTATESRGVAGYSQIQLLSSEDITILQGDSYSMTITGDSNMLPYIKTELHDNVLVVSNDKCNCGKQTKIEITVPKLNKMEIFGAGDVEFPEDFQFNDFTLNLSGAGDVAIKGKADNLEITLNGAGDIDAKNLKADNVRISINGAGDANIYANNSLNASINGAGDITYYGSASNVRKHVSGAGSISHGK